VGGRFLDQGQQHEAQVAVLQEAAEAGTSAATASAMVVTTMAGHAVAAMAGAVGIETKVSIHVCFRSYFDLSK